MGLSAALHLSRGGAEVVVYARPDTIGQASQVAAGMLGVMAEREWAPIDRLMVEARRYWKEFADLLTSESGIEVRIGEEGTFFVLQREEERPHLVELNRRTVRLGFSSEWFERDECEELHPLLTGQFIGALLVLEEGWVNPRRVYPALVQACEEAGVRTVSEEVVQVGVRGGHAELLLESGERVEADGALVAAGAWSGDLIEPGLAEGFSTHPVRGQYLLLRSPGHVGWPVVRSVAELAYLVPSLGADYLYLGASVEEKQWGPPEDFSAAFRVLDGMTRVMPGLAELEVTERGYGLRPATPDGLPAIGPLGEGAVYVATGHYRNGVLMGPLTGKLAAEEILGEDHGELLGPVRPARFASQGG